MTYTSRPKLWGVCWWCQRAETWKRRLVLGGHERCWQEMVRLCEICGGPGEQPSGYYYGVTTIGVGLMRTEGAVSLLVGRALSKFKIADPTALRLRAWRPKSAVTRPNRAKVSRARMLRRRMRVREALAAARPA